MPHSWCVKEEDVWSVLSALELKLASKKPCKKPIWDWRADFDLWRSQRLAFAKADINSNNDHLSVMRCLETCSNTPWYKPFRKDMAHDEARGVTFTHIDDLSVWRALEFEENYNPRSSSSQSINATFNDDRSKSRPIYARTHRRVHARTHARMLACLHTRTHVW